MHKFAARVAFSVLVAGAIAVFLFDALNSPVSETKTLIAVEIKSGMNTARIAGVLAEKKAIRSKTAFMLLAKLSGKSDKLKAGEYEIDASNTSYTILNRIIEGKSVVHPVTVPEGFTLAQIARLMEAKGFGGEASILKAARNPALLAEYGIKGKDAEGYLMPETYVFRKDATGEEIVRKMITVFMARVAPVVDKYRSGSSLDFHDILTLASIIEKEAAGPGEFTTISAVFHNRLKLNMPLQADPTVIYVIPNFDGSIHKKDLGIDSPYNTYRYKGLPPGPIANPGLRAIEAAYAPENVTYLYFVAMGTEKRHYFSTTLDEHNKAVRKYVLGLASSARFPGPFADFRGKPALSAAG